MFKRRITLFHLELETLRDSTGKSLIDVIQHADHLFSDRVHCDFPQLQSKGIHDTLNRIRPRMTKEAQILWILRLFVSRCGHFSD